jgi:anti-sigma B factor antagonist
MIHQECTIKVHKGSDLVTIEILGDLTASAEKPLNEAYREVCDLNIRNILLKFDGKSRINSTGTTMLVNLVSQSQEKGFRVLVTGISKHSRKIFELVGLTRYTTIVESEKEI